MNHFFTSRVNAIGFTLIFLSIVTLFFNNVFGFEGVLALLLIFTVFFKVKFLTSQSVEFSGIERAMTVAIVFYVAVMLFSVLINFSDQQSFEEFINKYAKSLYFIPFIFLLKYIDFGFKEFELLIKLTAYAIIVMLSIEVLVHGLGSHLGGVFSNKGTGAWFFSSVLISTLFLSIFHYKNESSKQALHYALLTLFLLFIIILTSTRSIWLSLFVSLILVLPFLIKYYDFHKFLVGKLGIFLLIGIVAVMSLNFDKLEVRFNQAVVDIKKMSQGDYNSSLGLRAVMYHVAYDGFTKNLLTGIGENNYETSLNNIYENKLGTKDEDVYARISDFKQIHNQFLMDAWMKGIAGLVSLLLLFLVPLIGFFKSMSGSRQGVIALIGIAYLILSFVFLLFGAVLTYSHGIVFFFFWLILLVVTIANTKKQASA